MFLPELLGHFGVGFAERVLPLQPQLVGGSKIAGIKAGAVRLDCPLDSPSGSYSFDRSGLHAGKVRGREFLARVPFFIQEVSRDFAEQ